MSHTFPTITALVAERSQCLYETALASVNTATVTTITPSRPKRSNISSYVCATSTISASEGNYWQADSASARLWWVLHVGNNISEK